LRTAREWYSYHFPELSKIVNDNIMFARIALYIGRRSDMPADRSVPPISLPLFLSLRVLSVIRVAINEIQAGD
jgi:RNA processing factor Prp31